MAVVSATTRALHDRLKLGAIPVLVAVLYFALTSSSGDRPAASTGSTTKKPGTTQAPTDEPVGEIVAARNPPLARAIPQFPLAHILEHDPFALPSVFVRQPPVAELNEPVEVTEVATASGADTEPTVEPQDDRPQRLAQLRQRRVNILLRDARGPAALIGTKLVHVGDTLEDGVRVVAIDSDSVVLELIAP